MTKPDQAIDTDRDLIERVFHDGVETICERGRDKFDPGDAEIYINNEGAVSSKIADTINKLTESVSNPQIQKMIKNSSLVENVLNEYRDNAWNQIYTSLNLAVTLEEPIKNENAADEHRDEYKVFRDNDIFLPDIDEDIAAQYEEEYLEPRFTFILNSFTKIIDGEDLPKELKDQLEDNEESMEELAIAYILREKEINAEELSDLLEGILSIDDILNYRDDLSMTMEFSKTGIGVDYTETTLSSLQEVTQEYLERYNPEDIDEEILNY